MPAGILGRFSQTDRAVWNFICFQNEGKQFKAGYESHSAYAFKEIIC